MATTPMHRVEVVLSGVPGAPYYSRIYFDASAGTALNHVAYVRQFWLDIRAHLRTAVTAHVVQEVATVDPVSGQITAVETPAQQPDVTGSSADQPLPPANQALLRWETGVFLGGRRLRGRTYIPSLTEAANTNGFVEPAVVTAVQNAAAALMVGGVAVYSPTHGQWQPATSAVVPTSFAVLRSRRD